MTMYTCNTGHLQEQFQKANLHKFTFINYSLTWKIQEKNVTTCLLKSTD